MRMSFAGTVEVFGGTEEPEVRDDDEVDDVPVEDAVAFMLEVEGRDQVSDDGHVDWIGAGRGIVFFPDGGHVISEYGTVVSGSCKREAGIFPTQVGDPLSNGRERLRCCISPDGLTTFSGTAAVSDGEDDDVGQSVFHIGDPSEGRFMTELSAEVCPLSKERALGSPGSRDICFGGGFERSAEISLEASSDARCNRRQGLACG